MPSWQSYLVKPAVRLLRVRHKLEEPTFAEQRTANDAMLSHFKFPPDVLYEPIVIEGLPAAWVTQSRVSTEQVILYLHGGAYVLGSLTIYRPTVATYAQAIGARFLMIEYRLAPEHPFPAAVDDARTAYHWLLAQGIRPEQIVVMGDSAGGGLTVALLLALRDEQTPLPAAAVCLSPWFDLACTGESMRTRAKADVILTPQMLKKAADAYLGTTDPRTPLASPLYADLHGLPPMLLQVGTEDILLDDAKRLALCAREAGVSIELEVWPNLIHVWQTLGRRLPEARQAIAHIMRFTRTHAPGSIPSASIEGATKQSTS
jgi:acetyl esterase/lipase